MFTHSIQGFFLQASLIFAVGAQNIFLLQCGLKNDRPFWGAFVSTLCDTFLIILGVLGVSQIFIIYPLFKSALGLLGTLFLAVYGGLKIREGLALQKDTSLSSARETQRSNHQTLDPADSTPGSNSKTSLQNMILLSLSFSLLNPHVYLDTVVLIGGFSTQFLKMEDRLAFGLGASLFSAIWFFGLSFLAKKLGPFLDNKQKMSKVLIGSGTLLIYLSLKLGLDVYQWIFQVLF